MDWTLCMAAAVLALPVPGLPPPPQRFACVSAASALYAVSVHGFRAMWYEGEGSLVSMLGDVFAVAACIPASLYSPRGWPVPYLSALVSVYLARRLYRRLVVGNSFRATRVDNKVYIITGSNTGLGYETTREIVRMGGRVVMACRTLDKAQAAREVLLAETRCRPDQLVVLRLDLNSFASVRHFVADFRALKLPLHCLVNNAGLMMSERTETPDGLEMVFTANHLSAFLLTSLLLPLLQEGAKQEKCCSRIVNVSSSLHKIPRAFSFTDVMSKQSYELFATYAQSKLANILFTLELQRRIDRSASARGAVTANCLHPGFVRTEVTRHMHPLLRIGNDIATPIMMTLQKTPPQGAFCTLHVATAPELEGRGGKYFANCLETRASPGGTSEPDAAQLWQLSDSITGAKWDL